MKPRIFISSTFYDLKYIREDLANFVRDHDYEPVLFEDGDIGYIPGNPLDKSCYESMKNSDMVILIIGGEYGSAASGENKDEFAEYMSVTRNEFRTAVDSGIPMLVLIDKKVMAEYAVYEANYDLIEKEKKEIKFSSTKNINVFRFIKEVKSIVTLPIQEFEKSVDIKGFISKQWADMFKNYLTFLRGEKENKKIEHSVNELKELIQKMDIMLDSVGKNVLSKENPEEYESVVNQQEIISLCRIISEAFEIKLKDESCIKDLNAREKIVMEFLNILKDTHKKGLWTVFESEDSRKCKEFFNLFDKEQFWVESIMVDYLDSIGEKYKLLYEEGNIKKIARQMIKDKYFDRLLVG